MNQNESESRDAELRVEERLTARMARMERRHGRHRWAVRGLALVTTVLVALVVFPLGERSVGWEDGSAPGEVRADRFVLLDSTGATRGVWQLAEDGAVRLTILDDAGRSRLNLAVMKEGAPGITLSDREERKRVVLGHLPDQTSTLVFADGAGVPRAVLGLSRQQAPNLLFSNQKGVGRLSLGLDSSGRASAMLPGLDGRVRSETGQETPTEDDGTP